MLPFDAKFQYLMNLYQTSALFSHNIHFISLKIITNDLKMQIFSHQQSEKVENLTHEPIKKYLYQEFSMQTRSLILSHRNFSLR